ncbi:MAG: metal-dependent hydrolase [Sciscionella sp.]
MPVSTTIVTFPQGSCAEEAVVKGGIALPDGRYGVITDVSPFHPLDHSWPDQPGDQGELSLDGERRTVADCVTAASGDGTEIVVGSDIPVRRGDPDWQWLVLHVLAGEQAVDAGCRIALQVDEPRRAALSAGHTGCHLAALALNRVLAPRWRKEVSLDGLGNPNFDQLAMASSQITEQGSVDTYRIGKSLRKKGFTPGDWEPELGELAGRVGGLLADWVAAGAEVGVHAEGTLLTDRREWCAELPQGQVALPCGGTHLRNTAELASLRVELSLDESGTSLVMRTHAELA